MKKIMALLVKALGLNTAIAQLNDETKPPRVQTVNGTVEGVHVSDKNI